MAAVLSSSAATTTTLGVRWDALATVLQLAAVLVAAERPTTRRASVAGILCGLAVVTKFSALWAPVALIVWLLVKAWRSAVWFAVSCVASTVVLLGLFDLISDGRALREIHMFALAGTGSSSRFEGIHRFYQLVLRNEQELPLLVLVAAILAAVAAVRRRVGVFEIGFAVAVVLLIIVLRDVGAYENHILDVEVLGGIVIAGAWSGSAGRRSDVVRLAISAALVLATLVSLRYTIAPDFRAAWTHELRGRSEPQYAVHPLPELTAAGTCNLFEDASLPILAGQRPVVVDAFILHRLQTREPNALDSIEGRIDHGRFSAIVLGTSLDDLGFFATLDFGTRLANAMRAHYRLASIREGGFYVYRPTHPDPSPSAVPFPSPSWN